MQEVLSRRPVLGFPDGPAFEHWLTAQPASAPGVWVKLAKKLAGVAGISKPQALDVALCHGWIDGQAAKYNDAYFLTRFTPRRPRSNWSEVNRSRALELIAEGRMTLAGMARIEAAKADGRWDAAYAPPSTATVPNDLREALDASPEAAPIFEALSRPSRWAVLYGLATVKKAETRARKIAAIIAMLERGETGFK